MNAIKLRTSDHFLTLQDPFLPEVLFMKRLRKNMACY